MNWLITVILIILGIIVVLAIFIGAIIFGIFAFAMVLGYKMRLRLLRGIIGKE